MKLKTIIYLIIILFAFHNQLCAQFDLDIKKKVEKKVNKEINKAADDAIDETAETIKSGGKTENKNETENQKKSENEKEPVVKSETNESTHYSAEEKSEELKIWSKYDFVAGDKIIFHDDLSGEENGEFPSRWDLISGSAEIASLGNEFVIHLTNNNSIVSPLLDKKDFLPEVFTIEFDIFFEQESATRTNIYRIRFYNGVGNSTKIDGKNVTPIEIRWNQIVMGQFGGKTSAFNEEKKNWKPKWKHVAISFNKRALKVYMDEERLINIPNLGFQPKMFSIGGHFDERVIEMSAIKNIRVNEGGKKLYDRVMSEGKFVTTGILFDVNKSTIKGESMGTINEIVNMLKEHSDLKFSIEGHTDSDGDDSFNQKLSEQRAESVRNVFIQSGIDGSRLKTKGWGESKPVDSNSTPEGKANNRRVEFIKI